MDEQGYFAQIAGGPIKIRWIKVWMGQSVCILIVSGHVQITYVATADIMRIAIGFAAITEEIASIMSLGKMSSRAHQILHSTPR